MKEHERQRMGSVAPRDDWEGGDRRSRRTGGRGLTLGLAVLIAVLTPLLTLSERHAAAAPFDPTLTNGLIRFVHVSPGAPPIDIEIDGVPTVKGLSYGQATQDVAVTPGDRQIKATLYSGEDYDLEVYADLFVGEGDSYIVSVIGNPDDVQARVDEVDLDDVDQGEARARFIMAGHEAESVDVVLNSSDELFKDVDYLEATDYEEVTAGAYAVEVRSHDDDTILAAGDVEVANGVVYDIFGYDLPDGKLGVLPLATRVWTPCSVMTGVGAASDACVRIVHAAESSPAVDLYLEGAQIGQGLGYAQQTAFFAVPAGEDLDLDLALAGNPGADEIADKEITLDAGQAYQITVVGFGANLELLANRVDLSPIPAGQARVRFINAGLELGTVDVELADGVEVFNDVDFTDATKYEEIDAGTYDVLIRTDETNLILTRANGVTIEPGMVYDVIALNDESGLVVPSVSTVYGTPAGGPVEVISPENATAA